MGWSRDLGFVEVDEVAGVAKVACVGLPSEESDLVKPAVDTAKAAVAAVCTSLGVKNAHIFIGAHRRAEEKGLESSPDFPTQSAQTSITVIVSILPDDPRQL